MARLEDITVGSSVKGLVIGDTVTIIHVEWYGTNVIEVSYKDSSGKLDNAMLLRDDESRLEILSDKIAIFIMHLFNSIQNFDQCKKPTSSNLLAG